jgi:glucuronate isomerase
LEEIFGRLRLGAAVEPAEAEKIKSAVLYECGKLDAEAGWVQQYHFGALRNNNTRMYRKLGADIGMDSIGDFHLAVPLSRLLDRLAREDKLAKTILYNLNPADNYVLATMIGNFQGDGVAGKMQFGSGWWFLDQIEGMTWQMNALSNVGLLSRFVGMLTDSRSFLSYTRHDYFRRLVCDLFGRDIEAGLIPADYELVGSIVRDISYNNAARYFGFGVQAVE